MLPLQSAVFLLPELEGFLLLKFLLFKKRLKRNFSKLVLHFTHQSGSAEIYCSVTMNPLGEDCKSSGDPTAPALFIPCKNCWFPTLDSKRHHQRRSSPHKPTPRFFEALNRKRFASQTFSVYLKKHFRE